MKKISLLSIVVICLTFSFNFVLADEDETKNQTKEIVNLINQTLSEIDEKISGIDGKIENAKEQKEFEYYPAVRLNVDTPMFGITSIIENKLRIKNDISTSDVADRYSIRNIVEDKVIRLPDSYLGSLVISTKKVEINEDMSLNDAKLALVDCIKYSSQVDSAVKYTDSRISKIFVNYIDNNKKSSLNDIKDRDKKAQKNLASIADEIEKMKLLGVDVSQYLETYNSLSGEIYDIENAADNSLILDSELDLLTKKSLANEASIIDLQNLVDTSYDDALLNMNYGTYLDNLYNEIDAKVKSMEDYINNSTVEETTTGEDGKEETTTTIKYEVTSKTILDNIKLTEENINTLRDDYKNSLSETSNEEATDEEKTNDEIISENEEKISDSYSKYKEALSRENTFYLNNINMLLRNSSSNVSSIIAQIDKDVEVDNSIFEYTKYIYLDLPNRLNDYVDKNNMSSILELDILTSDLKNELSNLSTTSESITTMYNKLIEDMLKS